MKKFVLGALAISSLALVACQSNPADVQKTAEIAKDGVVKEVKVKPINSFLIEISPRKALCDSVNGGQVECLQYRNRYQSNFNPLKTDIEGFSYETGFSYILDVKQEVIQNEAAGKLETKWVLNRIVSKTAAPLSN